MGSREPQQLRVAGRKAHTGGLGGSRVRGRDGHQSLECSGKRGSFLLRSHGRVTEGSQAGGKAGNR